MLWIRNITDYNEADIFIIFDHSFGYIQDIKYDSFREIQCLVPFILKYFWNKKDTFY